jgi:hypothetical protein
LQIEELGTTASAISERISGSPRTYANPLARLSAMAVLRVRGSAGGSFITERTTITAKKLSAVRKKHQPGPTARMGPIVCQERVTLPFRRHYTYNCLPR